MAAFRNQIVMYLTKHLGLFFTHACNVALCRTETLTGGAHSALFEVSLRANTLKHTHFLAPPPTSKPTALNFLQSLQFGQPVWQLDWSAVCLSPSDDWIWFLCVRSAHPCTPGWSRLTRFSVSLCSLCFSPSLALLLEESDNSPALQTQPPN